MATKMNAATAKRVKALGINAKTEEEAREKLLEILTENGIDGMEDEDTDTILDIAESFVEESNAATDETENEPETEAEPENSEEDELAQEVEEEAGDGERDEFVKMDRTALKAYIKQNGLNVTVKKSMTDDNIRDLIRQAEADDEVAEEDEVEPEEKQPAKKAEKPAKKETEKKAEKPAKKAEKEKPEGKRGTKLDPKNNEEDRKEYAPLKKLFPEDKFLYAWTAAGVTVKFKGQNSQRALVSIENCMKQADGTIKCNMYLLTLTKQTEILDKAEIDYQPCWSGAPMIKGTTLKEAIEIVSGLMEPIMATVQKIDKKLGDNRKKMEENLDKTSNAKTEKKKK